MLKLSNKYLLVIIFSILSLLNGYELYSQGESLNSNIYATIKPASNKDPISITWMADLNFGLISVTSTEGTVTIDPNTTDPPSSSGGVILWNSPTIIPTRAIFQLTGKQNQFFSITVNQSSIELQNIDYPGSSLTLRLSNNNLTRFNNRGIAFLYVGGTLNVDANQPKGTYTGTFVVNVNNQ